jgi:UDP-glucose 4-epimerase
MDVLITGGAGFIGSTIASAAIDAGHRPIILDDLRTGRVEFTRGRVFYEGDISDAALLERIVGDFPDIACVVHCAALIVVPDSVRDPVGYYRSNVAKTLDLVDALTRLGVTRLIFSSSASIYEPDADDFCVDESSPIRPTNPYARSKAMVESILADVGRAGPLRVLSLRYFNPIGADPQFRTGLQNPAPTHVIGKLAEAARTGDAFQITGTDFPTRDGTGIRDYIHVWDLALAHVRAIERFDDLFGNAHDVALNLGAGRGTTVRELVDVFNEVAPGPVQTLTAPRRPGDAAGAWTRSERAGDLLGWRAERSVADGIADTLTWFERRGSVLPDLGA